MRVPIIVPNLNSGEERLNLCCWLVEKGDVVVAGDLVAEVLIPGITFEIASETTGRLVEITTPVETEVLVGDVLCWLEDGAPEDTACEIDDRL